VAARYYRVRADEFVPGEDGFDSVAAAACLISSIMVKAAAEGGARGLSGNCQLTRFVGFVTV
jgi:hypothetical protein